MAAQQRRRVRRQGAGGHGGAEVGSADADIDDVSHGLAEGSAHPSLADVGGEMEHLLSRADDLRHDVLAVDQDRLAGEIAQGGVQDSALLGDVDFLAGEHRVSPGLDRRRLGELYKPRNNVGVDALLGIVEQEIVEGDAELLESRRIVSEIRSRRPRKHALAHAGQFRQCRQSCLGRHGPFPFPRLPLSVTPPRRDLFICRPSYNCETSSLRSAAGRYWTARTCRFPPVTASLSLGATDRANRPCFALRRGRSRRTVALASSSLLRASPTCRRSRTRPGLRPPSTMS